MKYKLLSVHHGVQNNIGDYIQALASSQFLPSIDGFINREELADYDGEECKVIMNGWYMHNPKHWPPSSKIHPLFEAFHLNTSVAEKMLSEKGVKYLKKYMPIGCRDTNTVNLLQAKGIDAYFSGCMTLTLGNKYSVKERNNSIYFVDPIIPKPKDVITISKNLFYLIANFSSCNKLFKKIYQDNTKTIKRMIVTAGYLRLYAKMFSKEIVVGAHYISQENDYYSNGFASDYDRLKEAERLVNLYASAKMVVTKRIHCALPCLGLNTPVIYTKDSKDEEMSSCRFGGLIDLFNYVTVYPDHISSNFGFSHISIDNPQENKRLWVDLAQRLTNTCTKFIKEK